MKIKIAYSTKTTINEIVADLKEQLKDFDYNLIQFYASSNIPPKELSSKLYEIFEQTPTFGCTTSGEIVSGKMLENSVVLMALSTDAISDFKIEVLEKISTDKLSVNKAFKSLEEHFGESLATLNPDKHFGFVLIDGLSLKEEYINERIGDLTNITFVGGLAGDDLKLKKTYVFANGKAYTDAAVICLVKSKIKFDVLKTQSFVSSKKKLTVTKADETNRKVLEFNHKPALEEYTKLTGFSKDTIYETFSHNPVGIDVGDDFFVRSPKGVVGNDMIFACAIKEGMELDLLESRDIIEDTKHDLNNKLKEFSKASVLVNFNCALRTIELQIKKQTQAYGEIFKDIPTIGFSCYGESYIGHINQTSVILLLGE